MTDLDKWKQWLDQWHIEYSIYDKDDERYGLITQIIYIGECAVARVIFKQKTHEYMYFMVED